jgi:hypothetical protein
MIDSAAACAWGRGIVDDGRRPNPLPIPAVLARIGGADPSPPAPTAKPLVRGIRARGVVESII